MNKDVSVLHSPPVFTSPYIKEIIDLSEDHSDIEKLLSEFGFTESLSMARMRILFYNDFQMSVIRGAQSFGGREGLFEIAIYYPDIGMTDLYFDEHDKGDNVLGHCLAERVQYYIDKIGSILNTDLRPMKTELIEFKNEIR